MYGHGRMSFKMPINLGFFLEQMVIKYKEIDICLKKVFNNSKQFHSRTHYRVKADFDKDVIVTEAELILSAETKFKRLNRRFFQARYYEESEIKKIFREAIWEDESDFRVIRFNIENNKVSLIVTYKMLYQKSTFSEELVKGWDEIVEELKKIATISKKLGICGEMIDAVQINNHYRSYSSKVDEKKDRLEKLQRLSPKALLNAKEIISELESLQKDYKGLDEWTLDKNIRKFLRDIICFLAPELEKTDSDLFPYEYYKVPGEKDFQGEDSCLFIKWTSNYLTQE